MKGSLAVRSAKYLECTDLPEPRFICTLLYLLFLLVVKKLRMSNDLNLMCLANFVNRIIGIFRFGFLSLCS